MAYGKDPQNLPTSGSFRQRANQYQHKREQQRSSGGGGGGFYWANQYKPSDEDPDMVRVIEGHYKVPQVVGSGKEAVVEMVELPFLPFSEHYDGREKKSCICSAGPFAGSKEKSDPCPGCELFFSGMEKDQNGKKKAGRMSRREMYVFTVLDYGIYHNVEQTDKTGAFRTKDDGTPWMEWKKCEGQGCDACRNNKETRRGATRHWALGWGHYTTLLDADKQIGKSCSNCAGVGTIRCIAWTCPACGDAIVDMSTTALKTKEIDELTSRPVQCKCGYEGFAQEIIDCMSCTNAGGLAKRATIFDVDMNVKRIKATDGGNQTTLSISQWSPPRPIDVNYKDFGKALDLPKIYAPTAPDKQCELFNYKPNASGRTPVTAGDAARPYGGQQQMQQPPSNQVPYGAPTMNGPAMPPPPAMQQPAPMAPPSAPAMSGFAGLPPPPDMK